MAYSLQTHNPSNAARMQKAAAAIIDAELDELTLSISRESDSAPNSTQPIGTRHEGSQLNGTIQHSTSQVDSSPLESAQLDCSRPEDSTLTGAGITLGNSSAPARDNTTAPPL
jgi:hypothetical protein